MPSSVPSYTVFTLLNGEPCHYDAECQGNPFFLSGEESQRRSRMRSTRNRELLENSKSRRTKSKRAKSESPSSQPSSNPTSEPTWVLRKTYCCFWWSTLHRSLFTFAPITTDWNPVESQVVPLRQNLVVRCVFPASITIYYFYLLLLKGFFYLAAIGWAQSTPIGWAQSTPVGRAQPSGNTLSWKI